MFFQQFSGRKFRFAQLTDRGLFVDFLNVTSQDSFGGKFHEAEFTAVEFWGCTVKAHVTVENSSADE